MDDRRYGEQGDQWHPITDLRWPTKVFDHSASDGHPPEVARAFPTFTHMKDSIIRYIGQGGSGCHDIHDNIWEHFFFTELDGHINILECNSDASGPTPNVFYNNILRHNDPSVGNAEGLWFCPNTVPEYWFNNLMYDAFPLGEGQPWAIAGPTQYPSCTNTGGQFLFNNTFVDISGVPCAKGGSATGLGGYLTAYNNHLIGSSWYNSTPLCVGGPNSSTNISMTDLTATAQGYTTGSSGVSGQPNNCANDTTTPCAPTSAANSTVGAGSYQQSYCNTLATYTLPIRGLVSRGDKMPVHKSWLFGVRHFVDCPRRCRIQVLFKLASARSRTSYPSGSRLRRCFAVAPSATIRADQKTVGALPCPLDGPCSRAHKIDGSFAGSDRPTS